MKIEVIRQPEVGQLNARDFLTALLADPTVKEVTVLTGWTQPSGVALVSQALGDFRDRGGIARLITGLSLGAASVEGLLAALPQFNEVFVGFDPSGRTFHSKAFVGDRGETARMLVGSQNLTRGGLVTNHELGLVADGPKDHPAIAGVLNHVASLLADEALVKVLTPAVLAQIEASGQVTFTKAATRGKAGVANKDGVFTYSTRAFRNDSVSVASGSVPTVAPEAEVDSLEAPSQVVHTVDKRWFKQLPKSDVLRPDPPNSPTNTVTLTQGGHPIDKETWFREEMFSDANWVPVPGKENSGHERAVVPFTVTGLTAQPFTVDLTVEYNPAHASAQSNRTTSIRWSGMLSKILKEDVDATGLFLTIERFADQTYRLNFEAEATGEFRK